MKTKEGGDNPHSRGPEVSGTRRQAARKQSRTVYQPSQVAVAADTPVLSALKVQNVKFLQLQNTINLSALAKNIY